jgi:hypothetical protein
MKRSAAEHGCLPGEAPAAAADGAAPIANRLPSRGVTAVLLLAAAALDLTRCGLVAATVRQAWEAAMPMSVGLAAAAVSIWTARGCRRGARWSGWAAFLIGAVSAPQASASGFSAAYMIPDGATAVLGVLVAVGVLATAGRDGRPRPPGAGPLEAPFATAEHPIATKRVSRRSPASVGTARWLSRQPHSHGKDLQSCAGQEGHLPQWSQPPRWPPRV